ncbi:hypothetical protein [Arthrobacter sp. NicSoilB8]|uniref:hypothetical protein n=1 Tax=Arthrobacter sp. NicSoilB8 TaxID=2830998 RepID=UPI001CC6D158|nr:hypothetical protein [Arthrobacter sp. NicSoilB8]
MIRPASTHPYHRSGPISDVPRIVRWQLEEEPPAEQPNAGQGWPPSPSALALEDLATELAEFLRGRRRPGPEQLPSSIRRRSGAQDSGVWRDQQLGEIEDLAGELKRKVARYASLRAVQSSGANTGPADATAVARIHQALEDMAATAMGLEIASRELFLRTGMAGDQALKIEAAQEQTARSAE